MKHTIVSGKATKKITFFVSVEVDDNVTEKEKREILSEFSAMSHRAYLDIAAQMKDKSKIKSDSYSM